MTYQNHSLSGTYLPHDAKVGELCENFNGFFEHLRDGDEVTRHEGTLEFDKNGKGVHAVRNVDPPFLGDARYDHCEGL